MKNLKRITLTASAFIALLAVGGCDGTPSANTWTLSQPENVYEIDAWGSNPDLLEFTPKQNPDYFCVLAVSGADELKTMFCMPKKKDS